jgi:Zn finger protein HypA/HybF involved in hydrogenase expression
LEPFESFLSPSLDYIHRVEEEMLCEDCHEDWPPLGPPPNGICIECHGETQVGFEQLTAMYEPDPHDPHQGEYVPCSYCHKNFGPLEIADSCGLCHVREDYKLIEGAEAPE